MSGLIPQAKLDVSTYRPKSVPRVAPPPRVRFSTVDAVSASMGEMLSLPPQSMQAKMPMFSDSSLNATGLPALVLKFSWPGYEKYDMSEVIPVAGRTNGQIAIVAAEAYREFIAKAAKLPCSDPRYAITPGSLSSNIKNLHLCSLNYVCADLFVAEVEVIARARGIAKMA